MWETLLDVHGDAADRAEFRLTYPFSPAFLHAMVDISGALQRERTALKLMQQLLSTTGTRCRSASSCH